MSTSNRGTRGTRPLAIVISALAAAAIAATAAATPSTRAADPTFGRTTPGSTFGFPGADYKYGSRFALAQAGVVTKLSAHMKGRLAGGATAGGTQRFRMMVYAADGPNGEPGTLLATSVDRVLADNAAEADYDFALPSGVTLQPGGYWLMQQSGATDAQVGLSEDIGSPGNQRFNVDVFADGPSNPAGPMSADPKEYAVYATYTPVAQGGGGTVVLCHKPGTPAQKTMTLPASAVGGHLGHGDRLDAC
jgi:hypothetical protein